MKYVKTYESFKVNKKEEELNEWAMILGGAAFVLFIMVIGGYELMQFCQTGNRCGR